LPNFAESVGLSEKLRDFIASSSVKRDYRQLGIRQFPDYDKRTWPDVEKFLFHAEQDRDGKILAWHFARCPSGLDCREKLEAVESAL
jgi:hypothetical protein